MFQTRATQSHVRVAQIFFAMELEILTGRGAVSKWVSLTHGATYKMDDFHKSDTIALPVNTGVLFQFSVSNYDDAVERFFVPYKAAYMSRKIPKPTTTDRPMAFYETKGVCRVFVVIQCARTGPGYPPPRQPMDLVNHYKSLIPTYIFSDKDADAAAMCVFNAWLAGKSPFSASLSKVVATTVVEDVIEDVVDEVETKKTKKRERSTPAPPPPSPVAVDLSLRIDSPAPLPVDDFDALDRLFTDPDVGFLRPVKIDGDERHTRYMVVLQFPHAEMRNWILDALAADRLELAREIVKSFVSRIGHRDAPLSGGGLSVTFDTCCPVNKDVPELSYVTGHIERPNGIAVGAATTTLSAPQTLCVTVANVRSNEEYASIGAIWNECKARVDVHQPIRQLIRNRCRGERLNAEEAVALLKFGEEVEHEQLLNVMNRINNVQEDSHKIRLDTCFKWAGLKGEKSPDDEEVVEFSFDGMRKKQCGGIENLLECIEAEIKI